MKRINKLISISCALSFCALTHAAEVEVPTTFVAGTVAKASEINDNFKALADGINDNNAKADANTVTIDTNAAAIATNKANIEGLPLAFPKLQLHVKDYGLVGDVIGGTGLVTIIDTGNEIILIQSDRTSLMPVYYSDSECLNPVVRTAYGFYKGLGKNVIVGFDTASSNLFAVDSTSTLMSQDTYYASFIVTNDDGTTSETCIDNEYADELAYSVKVVPRPSYFDNVTGQSPRFASEVELRFAE